jgi:hypothetical protein
MAALLGAITVTSGFVCAVATVVFFLSRTEHGGRTAGAALFIALFASLFLILGAPHWAGQGHAMKAAHRWIERWRPEAYGVECEPRDIDADGYIFCTVGWTREDGVDQLEVIECGVDVWYLGRGLDSCRLWRPRR